MELLSRQEVLFATLGALALQLLGLLDIKNTPKAERPDFKDFFYWLPFFVSPVLGGFIAFAYVNGGDTLTPMLSINVGVSAPLLLKSLATSIPMQKVPLQTGPGA